MPFPPPPAESPPDVDVTATLPSGCIRVAIKTCSTPPPGPPSGPPPDHPRPRIGAIHQASSRRTRFDQRDPLREHQEARDAESKTEGEPFMSCVGSHRRSLTTPPPGHPRDHPTACDDSHSSRLRGFPRTTHRPPPETPNQCPPMRRPVHVACPSPSRNCSPSALREVPRLSPPTRHLVHVACPSPSTTYSPGASRTSSRRPSRASSTASDDTSHGGSGGHQGWTSRRLRRSPGTLDAAARQPSPCISRDQDLLTTGLRDHPPEHPRRVSARSTGHHRDALGLYPRDPLREHRKLWTRSRRRRAR